MSNKIENPKQPKRIGNLYQIAFTEEALYAAYIDARKGKRKAVECYEFELALGAEIESLATELADGSYMPKPLKRFEIREPKLRIIHAPHFRDLVVQHAIYRLIYPIFNKSFIDQSFACRKGGGTHKASDYAQASMRKYGADKYYAKLDIRKFFYSIDRAILRKQFERKIKDKRFVDLMSLFAGMNDPKGIPIGNLLSQIYALIYLNQLDHFVKRTLKIKHYVRYVDDFVAIGLSLEDAKAFKADCEAYVKQHLNLDLSHWTIGKIKKGINFVGYRTWRKTRYVRKHSVIKFKRAVKEMDFIALASFIGHAKHSATIVFYAHFLSAANIINQLPKRSKQLCHDTLNTHPLKMTTQHCDSGMMAFTI